MERKAEKWYKKSHRRSLVDMHIEDCDERFLSELSPDAYVEYLKAANIDSAMIYLQSHVGLCHYPTKTGVMHKNLTGREDIIKRTIEKIHEAGMFAVGYYSLIYNTREEERHPDWRMIDDKDGGTSPHQRGGRYGFLCPNNMEHRAFVKAQLSEIGEYFELDGLFLDMTFWPASCKCECCRARFEKETGIKNIPSLSDFESHESELFRKARYRWMTDFATDITEHVRRVMPGVSVSHNNASAVAAGWTRGVDESIGDLCDYVTGDIYGTLLGHSFSMKYYRSVSNDQPFEYMLTRFSQNLSQHTLSKTERELTQGVLLIAAHHGASFVIDAIDPVGTLNPDVAKLIGKAYAEEKKYEKYLSVGKPVSDVGLWYSITGRYTSFGQSINSLSGSIALGETLGANHVLYDVVTNKTVSDLNKYKIVLAPALAGLEDEQIEAAKEYVTGGGELCFSGVECPELLREFFGGELLGFSEGKNTYSAPTKSGEALFAPFSAKYPLSLSDTHPLVKMSKGVSVLATLTLPYSHPTDKNKFASIHSNPPVDATEYPSVVEAKYGKGRVLWLAVPFDGYSGRQHRAVTVSMLRRFLKESEQTLITDAPSMVEAVVFASENEWQISFCNVGDAEDGRKIAPFRVSLKIPQPPTRVRILPEEREIEFSYSDGMLSFVAEEIDLFAMYAIKMK